MSNEFSFLDLLTILSFVIQLENLKLNEQQSEKLDRHLEKQDKEMLVKIIQQNKEIIQLLKGENHAQRTD